MKSDKRSLSYSQVKSICEQFACTNRGQLQTKAKSAYAQAKSKGYLDRLAKELRWTEKRILSKAVCVESAKLFSSRSEFKKMDQGAYVTARKRGWLNEICAHMKSLRGRNLSYDVCKKVATKFMTRSALNERDPSIYGKIMSSQWFELFAHMVYQGDRLNKVVYEICLGRRTYIGHTANTHLRRMRHLENKQIRKLLNGGAQLILLSDVIPIEEALLIERQTIKSRIEEGYLVLNKTQGGEPGGAVRIWTDMRLKNICLEFDSKAHLRNDPRGKYAWQAICNRLRSIPTEERQGFWEKIAPHFPKHDKRNQGRRAGWLTYSERQMAKMAKLYGRATDMRDSAIALHQRIYFKITRLKLRNKLAPHWVRKRPPGTLTEKELIRIGLQYKRPGLWIKSDKGSYNRASRLGLLKRGTPLWRHFIAFRNR